MIVIYFPFKTTVQLYNPNVFMYTGEWFDPVENKYSKAQVEIKNGMIKTVSDKDSDMVLILRKTVN